MKRLKKELPRKIILLKYGHSFSFLMLLFHLKTDEKKSIHYLFLNFTNNFWSKDNHWVRFRIRCWNYFVQVYIALDILASGDKCRTIMQVGLPVDPFVSEVLFHSTYI